MEGEYKVEPYFTFLDHCKKKHGVHRPQINLFTKWSHYSKYCYFNIPYSSVDRNWSESTVVYVIFMLIGFVGDNGVR